jgi:hypothetical protein
MTAPDPGARRRSLSDDLLEDLKQGAPRTPSPMPARPATAAVVAAPEVEEATPESAQTPTVELRITPRSWSPAGVTPLPEGGGVAVSLGPLRVSLWRNRG